jgi:Secretion system C-terminal sorting domain
MKTYFKKISLTLIISICFFSNATSQINFNSQMVLGGDSSDWVFSSTFGIPSQIIFNKSRNSTLLAISSNSPISGNKTIDVCNNAAATSLVRDIWMVEIDSNNAIINQKSFGGKLREQLPNLLVDSVNQCIYLVCESESPITCNKTASKYGDFDVWVVKMDFNFNIIWDKTFGGYGRDYVESIALDYAGNLILMCRTQYLSGGNISAVPIAPISGLTGNICMFKIDGNGNILLNKYIGCMYGTVEITSIHQLPDHSFVLTGNVYGGGDNYVLSPIQPTFHICGYYLRVDSAFNYISDSRYGGSANNGFMPSDVKIMKSLVVGNHVQLACTTDSLWVTNFPTVNFRGGRDVLLIETDLMGNVYGVHIYGGTLDDEAVGIYQDANGDFYLSCFSNSSAGYEKSDNSRGGFDVWLMKLDAALNKVDDVTIGTTLDDYYSTVGLFGNKIAGAVNIIGNCGGDFNLTPIDTSSSDVWYFTMNSNLSVGLSDVQVPNGFSVSPNPVHSLLNISGLAVNSNLTVYDLQGRLVLSRNAVAENKIQLDVSGLASGMYIISDNHHSYKFIKN